MPGHLHAKLKQEAADRGISLNQACIARLERNQSLLTDLGTKAAAADLIIPEFLSAIVRQWPDELVGLILFGSAARGDATEDSDIDLLLVMTPEVKIARDLYRLWDDFCDAHFGTRDYDNISPHFVNLPGGVQEAGGLWYEVAIEGMVLWESDPKVSRFLRSVRAAMGQGKIRRRMVHGSPYWVKS
jgi:predicted nucleotidyltransferase